MHNDNKGIIHLPHFIGSVVFTGCFKWPTYSTEANISQSETSPVMCSSGHCIFYVLIWLLFEVFLGISKCCSMFQVYEGHENIVRSISVSPTGQWMASGRVQLYSDKNATVLGYSVTILKYSAVVLRHSGTVLKYCKTVRRYSRTVLRYSATVLRYSVTVLRYSVTVLRYSVTMEV